MRTVPGPRLRPGCLAVHPAPVRLAPLIAALLAVQSGAAVACSIDYDPRPVEEQLDDWARSRYLRAEAMVEVVAIEGSRRHSPGLVRVVRVLKGPVPRGRVLALRAVDPSLCGAGHFKRGSRGLILIDNLRGRPVFHGYLPPDYLQRLDRLGLRPLDGRPAQSR